MLYVLYPVMQFHAELLSPENGNFRAIAVNAVQREWHDMLNCISFFLFLTVLFYSFREVISQGKHKTHIYNLDSSGVTNAWLVVLWQ